MKISILCINDKGEEYWKARNEPLQEITDCGQFIIVEHSRWQTTLIDKREQPMFIIK